MRIGIIGAGNMAAALGAAWAAAGHDVLVGGRSPERSETTAERIRVAVADASPTGAAEGGGAASGDGAAARGTARAVTPREAAEGGEALLLAVLWEGMEELLALAGGPDGALAGKPLLDCTNAVEHAVGLLLPPAPGSAAACAAELAHGAHVVKAFHLFPAAQWDPAARAAAAAERAAAADSAAAAGAAAALAPAATVPLCGDDDGALAAAAQLVRDAGGVPAILPGGLARARQLEEAAGFVIGLAFSGADPAAAVPHVP